jgi:hypothetical protein
MFVARSDRKIKQVPGMKISGIFLFMHFKWVESFSFDSLVFVIFCCSNYLIF